MLICTLWKPQRQRMIKRAINMYFRQRFYYVYEPDYGVFMFLNEYDL
jgi:hypothetical protein